MYQGSTSACDIHLFLYEQCGVIRQSIGVEKGYPGGGFSKRLQALLLQLQDARGILAVERPLDTIGQATFCLRALQVRNGALSEVIQRQLANIDPVHPGQLRGIIDASSYTDTVESESFNQLLPCEELGFVIV